MILFQPNLTLSVQANCDRNNFQNEMITKGTVCFALPYFLGAYHEVSSLCKISPTMYMKSLICFLKENHNCIPLGTKLMTWVRCFESLELHSWIWMSIFHNSHWTEMIALKKHACPRFSVFNTYIYVCIYIFFILQPSIYILSTIKLSYMFDIWDLGC